MRREAIQETNPALLFENKSKKEQLLKYNGMSIDELLNEQANLETDLSNGFFDILFQNNIDIAQIDSKKTMDHVINEYIADGKIDEISPQTVKWLEKNTLSRTLENIIRGKQGEQEQSRQNVDQEKVNKNVDRIRAITNTLQTLTGIDQMATKESLIEINTLINKKKNLDAYNLSKKLLRELESKYKLNLEQQKDQVKTNFDLLLTKLKIADQFGIKLPNTFIDILKNLTAQAQKEHVSKALQLTEHMKEMVDGWLQSQENGTLALSKAQPQEAKNERELKKLRTVQEKFELVKNEAKKSKISQSNLPFSDIQKRIEQSDFDGAMNQIDQTLEYINLTRQPQIKTEKTTILQNSIETPQTQNQLDEANLEYAPNIFDNENTTKQMAQRVLQKTQSRLDAALTHPETLTEKEENVLRKMMSDLQTALEMSDLKKAHSLTNKLSRVGALLSPMENDYDYKKNLSKKAGRNELSLKRKKPSTFETGEPAAIPEIKTPDDWADLVLPETVILPVTEKIQPPSRATQVDILRPRQNLEKSEPPTFRKTEEVPIQNIDITPEKPPTTPMSEIVSDNNISAKAKKVSDEFDDTEPFIEDEETEPLQGKISSPAIEIRRTQPTEPQRESDVAETPLEQDFFRRGEAINEEHQALAQEKRGFFGRVFDKFRPSFETPEDKLIRTLQKEKWLQNIPKMSHAEVLVSLKKFKVDLTKGAVDEQLKNVGPLLRSNTEAGEVFKALWNRYLETQEHEKKEWDEAIPTMDINRVYLNLEKFGINPNEDGRRDVRAKIINLRNEAGKRGEVFRMLFDRYIEIQNNNIRALQTADQKQVIQFLKTGYKIDPTYYFEDSNNEKVIQDQKHIEELRTEYSTRGKVIDAAMRRLEKLQEDTARAKILPTLPQKENSEKRKAA